MAGRIARWGLALGLCAVWWWAVLRLTLTPHAGALEGAVAAGGWGLSLLPVHCMPKARAAGAVAAGRWRAAWRGSVVPGAGVSLSPDVGFTGAGAWPDSGVMDVGVSLDPGVTSAEVWPGPGGTDAGMTDAAVTPGLGVTDAGGGPGLGVTDAGVWSADGPLPGEGPSSGAWPSSAPGPEPGAESVPVTKASPRRRSDGESGP